MSHWLFESVRLICLEEVVELAQQDDGPSEESLTKQGGVINMGVTFNSNPLFIFILFNHHCHHIWQNGILICMYSTMQVNQP